MSVYNQTKFDKGNSDLVERLNGGQYKEERMVKYDKVVESLTTDACGYLSEYLEWAKRCWRAGNLVIAPTIW